MSIGSQGLKKAERVEASRWQMMGGGPMHYEKKAPLYKIEAARRIGYTFDWRKILTALTIPA